MLVRVASILFLIANLTAAAQARVWTDKTGLYTLEADLIGLDDEQVILQRTMDKELGAFPLDDLSIADREYLKSKEALDLHTKSIDAMQTWTSKDGLKVVGRVVDYAQRKITIQRRRGQIYINNMLLGNVPRVYQVMLPDVVGHFEKVDLADETAFIQWVNNLGGVAKTYDLEGVILELENGDEYGVPFFMFSEKDQAVLKGGWQAWLKDHGDYEKTDDHAFRLQSLAATYQRNEEINQQIAIMNLNMNAITAGLTSAWEVTLYPQPGNPYPPRWVVVLGRNSLEATQNALRQNPGFVDGPVRRVSRR